MLEIIAAIVLVVVAYWSGYLTGRRYTLAAFKTNKTAQVGNVVVGDMCGGDLNKTEDATASSFTGCCCSPKLDKK